VRDSRVLERDVCVNHRFFQTCLAAIQSAGRIIDLCVADDHPDKMMTQSGAKVTVRRMGREGEPLVVIDQFSGIADQLLEAGMAAQYQNAGASYPGIRCWADPGYLDRRRPLMMQLMQQVFGFSKGVRLDASTYSLVTVGEDELSPLQRIPHYDHASGEVIAVMHYLLGPESGGTAFYRHRRTGFEIVTPAREATYNAALAEDERAYGMPPKRYCHGDSTWFEMIDEVEAKPDRLILYRGRQLHSGVIPDPAKLSSNPKEGRLTINMFLIGE
jgi:Family of unknown function (DUF6445)